MAKVWYTTKQGGPMQGLTVTYNPGEGLQYKDYLELEPGLSRNAVVVSTEFEYGMIRVCYIPLSAEEFHSNLSSLQRFDLRVGEGKKLCIHNPTDQDTALLVKFCLGPEFTFHDDSPQNSENGGECKTLCLNNEPRVLCREFKKPPWPHVNSKLYIFELKSQIWIRRRFDRKPMLYVARYTKGVFDMYQAPLTHRLSLIMSPDDFQQA